MTDARGLHEEAMALADLAAIERAAGHWEETRRLSAAAFEMEQRAAFMLESRYDLEPTRSVLFRSAASLALDYGDHRMAEKLIARALGGDPPEDIANDLRDLLENVSFQRHLELRGVDLRPEELQMSIEGSAIAYGMADSHEFIWRIQQLDKLIFRTVERQAGRPFRERGRRDKSLSMYLSLPRAGSYAITVRVGLAKQLSLPTTDKGESAITELLECMDTLLGGDRETFERRIPEESYRRNFVALVRRMAPDGDAVKSVGFMSQSKRVLLARIADEIAPVELNENVDHVGQQVTIEGILKMADSTKRDSHKIGIVDDSNRSLEVEVPEGMMDDIVKPLWDSRVRVMGVRRTGGSIFLIDIAECPAAE